jgi:hypothetical protein
MNTSKDKKPAAPRDPMGDPAPNDPPRIDPVEPPPVDETDVPTPAVEANQGVEYE